jgi:1,4-alpha-glucan branching enzyme
VALVGDFNDWDTGATQLRTTASGGLWTVEVPLAPGRHRYAFVVDGEEWRPDPAAPRAPGADFGTPSSVVTVVERRS